MSDDLTWSWCNNSRNKVHNKCNVLESSQNHPSHSVHGKILFSRKQVPDAKKVGDGCIKILIFISLLCVPNQSGTHFSNQNPESQNGEVMHPRSHSLQRAKSLISCGPTLSIIPLWNVRSLFENCLGLISTFPLSRILIYKQTATLPTLLSSPPFSQVYPSCSF